MNVRLETIQQLLFYVQQARNHEDELLMKDVWGYCLCEEEYVASDEELDVVLAFLRQRERELLRQSNPEADAAV